MILSSYDMQKVANERMKDFRREVEQERLAKHNREIQRESLSQSLHDTRRETRRNSSPVWARIWSLF